MFAAAHVRGSFKGCERRSERATKNISEAPCAFLLIAFIEKRKHNVCYPVTHIELANAMRVPKKHLERFVSELTEECLISRETRVNRYLAYKNTYLLGSENPDQAAIYNKTYTYIDDLESLLYSPVSLRFRIGQYETTNVLDLAKFRVAGHRMHQQIRQSSLDTMISEAVEWSLVKGKALIKTLWGSKGLSPHLIQPENFGVLQENRTKLDQDMEAFVHTTYITPYQFRRLVWSHPNREQLLKKAKRYMRPPKGDSVGDDGNAMKQIIIGGLYPLQAAGLTSANATRGIVDWMSGPAPELSPDLIEQIMRLDELWVWNDEQDDWATFQIVGDDMLIMGEDFITNALAYDPDSGKKDPELIGHHPFAEFCPNRIDNYFWGRSEIVNVALLQECINTRITGINMLLRLQENPPKKFRGVAGVNQNVLARLNKPGGHWNDSNASADVANMAPEIPDTLWASLHEYERMFDDMGGLPPIAKGRGESGVRSQGHAETLVRMFTPRFKDRALLVERDVEAIGGLVLDLCRAHVAEKMTAWVPKAAAGGEANPEENVFRLPPVPGQVPVDFAFKDLEEDAKVMVDSHSASPAFAMEARSLAFDLLKVGAMDAEQLVEHVDAPDPEALVAGIERRAYAKEQFAAQHPEQAAEQARSHKKKA